MIVRHPHRSKAPVLKDAARPDTELHHCRLTVVRFEAQ